VSSAHQVASILTVAKRTAWTAPLARRATYWAQWRARIVLLATTPTLRKLCNVFRAAPASSARPAERRSAPTAPLRPIRISSAKPHAPLVPWAVCRWIPTDCCPLSATAPVSCAKWDTTCRLRLMSVLLARKANMPACRA
jgi:hypothetical protein